MGRWRQSIPATMSVNVRYLLCLKKIAQAKFATNIQRHIAPISQIKFDINENIPGRFDDPTPEGVRIPAIIRRCIRVMAKAMRQKPLNTK